MRHSLTLNLAICLITLIALIGTANPLCLFTLFFLQDLSFGLVKNPNAQHDDEGEDDHEGNDSGKPMGFVH